MPGANTKRLLHGAASETHFPPFICQLKAANSPNPRNHSRCRKVTTNSMNYFLPPSKSSQIFNTENLPSYESQSTLIMVTETFTIHCCITCHLYFHHWILKTFGMTAQQDLAEDLNTLILHEYQLNRNCSHSTQPSMSHAHHTESLLR